MRHLARKRLPLTLLLAALVAPGAARANGFALDIQGVFSNGTATAGAASTHDPAGQFANPAVLASLDGYQVIAGGMLIAGKAPFTDGGSTFAGGGALPGSNRDGATSGVSPWVFASYRIRPDLAVGFSAYAPFGSKTEYGKQGTTFIGRYQGVESNIESFAFGPAVAWKPIEQVSVGVSAAARRDSAVIGQALDLGSMAGAPGALDGYGRFSATGWGWTATGGITVAPVEGTRLGAAYRHESTSTVKGHESFDETARAVLTGGGFTLNGDPAASMKLPLPDFATVSLEQKVGKSFTVLAAFQYSLWNRFDTLELKLTDPANGYPIPPSKQGFRNAFRVSGAGVYTVRPGMDVFAGVAFEQSPITTKYRQVTLPERDSLIAGAGIDAAVYKGLTVGACYQRVQMLGTSRIDQAGLTDHVVGSVKGSANVGVLQIGWKG